MTNNRLNTISQSIGGTGVSPVQAQAKACGYHKLLLDCTSVSLQPALLLEGQVGLVNLAPGNLEIPGHLVRQAPPP